MSLRYCPAGRHPMDPGWETCPYCASESSRTSDATRRSVDPTPAAPDSAGQPAGYSAGQSAFPKDGRTVFGGAGGEGTPARRVVGIVVTYTWRPEGDLFPVYEGSNLIGSSAECEIRVSTDPRISARHACIVNRPGGFWIDDEKSMNGTFVDGELIEEKRRLPESAVLRTGGTAWRFVALEPPPES